MQLYVTEVQIDCISEATRGSGLDMQIEIAHSSIALFAEIVKVERSASQLSIHMTQAGSDSST